MKKLKFVFFLLLLVIFLGHVHSSLYAEDAISEQTPTEESTPPPETDPSASDLSSPESSSEETETPTEETEEPRGETDQPEEEPVIVPPASLVKFMIRANDTFLFEGELPLPEESDLEITDSEGSKHTVSSRSVLALLYNLDIEKSEFSISDLKYYSSFSSFYIKCITPLEKESLCDNWQYAVDATTPFTSIDKTPLSGNETVGIYFGSSRRVVFDSPTITADTPFSATAQKYNYRDNTWLPLPGVTIGVTSYNPEDPYNPTVIFSKVSDENGKSILTVSSPGKYAIGIAEDYYFPTYNIEITKPNDPPAGGGGSYVPPAPVFNIQNAISYLKAQELNAVFKENMYVDWTGIALGALGDLNSPFVAKIIELMSKNNTVSSLLTENERRAMAILALNQDPYLFYGVNYIAPIINAFDGVQFGDSALVNDDIFALIPLVSAGYTDKDEIVLKDIDFIVSKQKENGSWEDNIDMTAAGIQALTPFKTISFASDALLKAGSYMQSRQENDGGFGSIYSTSWAAQAMKSLGASWTKNGKSISDYLAKAQAMDGAVLSSIESIHNRVWATSYVIPAVLGKTWAEIMHPVKKQIIEIPPLENLQEIQKEETVIKIEKAEKSTVNLSNKSASVKNISATQTSLPQLDPKKENENFYPLSANALDASTPMPAMVWQSIAGILLFVALPGLLIIRK